MSSQFLYSVSYAVMIKKSGVAKIVQMKIVWGYFDSINYRTVL